MTQPIVTTALSKAYASNAPLALDTLSLHVKAGEIYGFLGANGAGKSTTIRVLMNFIQPSSGSATILGLDSVRDSVAIKKSVGYLAGDVALYSKATGRQLLDFLLDLQGEVDRSYLQTLTKRFDASLDKPIAELSKGNRQKIAILQACMHQPAVLIMDEPTSGLDPLMQEAFYETLREAKARGAAILMSSHNLSEAQGVCDRIGIIKHGKLIHEQSLSDQPALTKTIFAVTLAKADDVVKLTHSKHLNLLEQSSPHSLRVQVTDSLQAALKDLSTYDIQSLSTEELNLENEFMEYYGDAA